MGDAIIVVMPLTFPAHQGPVLSLKILKPEWFSATALVVGSASPDLLHGLWIPDTFSSHSVVGLVVFAIPFTVVYSIVFRRWAADGLFGALPDCGPLRLRSYRVLSQRRPSFLTTVVSATIGAASHVFIDSFTHAGRWGSRLTGLDQPLGTPVGIRSGSKLLQWFGHSAGSMIGVLLFVWIAARFLPDWYGSDEVEAARDRPVAPNAQRRAIRIVGASLVLGVAWSFAPQIHLIFSVGTFLALGLLAAGVANDLGFRRGAGTDRHLGLGIRRSGDPAFDR